MYSPIFHEPAKSTDTLLSQPPWIQPSNINYTAQRPRQVTPAAQGPHSQNFLGKCSEDLLSGKNHSKTFSTALS